MMVVNRSPQLAHTNNREKCN